MATVLRFPVPIAAGRFTDPVRQGLLSIAASLPGSPTVTFDVDAHAEFCCVGDVLTLCWDAQRRLVIVDNCFGLIERGSFRRLDEVRTIIEARFAREGSPQPGWT